MVLRFRPKTKPTPKNAKIRKQQNTFSAENEKIRKQLNTFSSENETDRNKSKSSFSVPKTQFGQSLTVRLTMPTQTLTQAGCMFTYYAGFTCQLWCQCTFVVPTVRLPNQCITIGYLIS